MSTFCSLHCVVVLACVVLIHTYTIHLYMPLILNCYVVSFQIWHVLPEVVWSLPQDCWQLVFYCLVCDTPLWPQQPVGCGVTLCHVFCTKSNGSFYCMEVSFVTYIRLMAYNAIMFEKNHSQSMCVYFA